MNLFSAFLNQLFALSSGFLNYFCWNDTMHLCLCSCHWCEDLVQECDKICLQPNLITPQFLMMLIVFDCWAPDKGKTKSKLKKSRQLSVQIEYLKTRKVNINNTSNCVKPLHFVTSHFCQPTFLHYFKLRVNMRQGWVGQYNYKGFIFMPNVGKQKSRSCEAYAIKVACTHWCSMLYLIQRWLRKAKTEKNDLSQYIS